MKRLILSAAALLVGFALVLGGAGAAVEAAMPPYNNRIGDNNFTEKITGLYLVEQAAARDDNLIIYGSSELRSMEVSTHPSNFFAGERAGFQVNLVGRGSCQSLIHAISIAATGDALAGKKVALITSPQSYIPEGIAPDLFYANFSEQQYLQLLRDPNLSNEVKQYLSTRVSELLGAYSEMPNAEAVDPATRWLAEHETAPTALTTTRDAALTPYYTLTRYLEDLRDKVTARALLESVEASSAVSATGDIDWTEEESAAVVAAKTLTDNNDYGMLNDYYTTYIGSRYDRQKDKDAALDYAVSKEYNDLRALLEICRQKGVEPLFIHVPLHGQWSDYTGFPAERRQAYYNNVREIVQEYGVELLDLTGMEYEQYAMCDVMHLGWKGWLEVDRALIDYYYGH